MADLLFKDTFKDTIIKNFLLQQWSHCHIKGEKNLLSFDIDQGFIFRLSVQNPIF